MTNPQRMGLLLDFDLNCTPAQNWALNRLPLGLDFDLNFSQEDLAEFDGWFSRHTVDDVEVLDDEIAIISSQSFSQAIENSKRIHSRGTSEVIGEAVGTSRRHTAETNLCSKYVRMQGDCSLHLKPETSNKSWVEDVPMPPKPHPLRVPEESVFSCPVCLGDLIEPTATKCGHIFCKECILKSMKALHHKCPTCRQKVGKRSIFRVYLPTTK